MEKVVAQRVAGRLRRQRETGRVVEAHHQAFGVADQRELVHPPAVDLNLLLIEAMHQVPRGDVRRHELPDVEGGVGQVAGDRGHAGNGRQRGEWRARPVHLPGRAGSGREPVGAGELAVHVVEAAILEIDDYDVIELAQLRVAGAAGIGGARQGELTPGPRTRGGEIGVAGGERDEGGAGEPGDVRCASVVHTASGVGNGTLRAPDAPPGVSRLVEYGAVRWSQSG